MVGGFKKRLVIHRDEEVFLDQFQLKSSTKLELLDFMKF